MAKHKVVPRPNPKRIYLADTILYGDEERETRMLRPPCKHLGERTDKRAKMACKTTTGYAPIYRCGLFRIASPFGMTSDPDLIVSCVNCDKYQKAC